MPVYEYECGHCNYRFDIRQGFDDEPQAMCPQCQGRARRVFHPAPIIYKGSGFYITDSRKHKESETSKDESAVSKGEPEASKSEKRK